MRAPTRTLLALFAALIFAGCGDDHGHGDDHGDNHDHAAAHGGVLVETSDHSMHFEVNHDVDAGLLKVWVYDGEMQAVETSAPTIRLAKDSGGSKLTGMCPKGRSTAHEWHFSDNALEHHVHGRLRLKHDGKSYNVDLPEGDGDHGHGHGHGHDDDHHGHGEHGPHDGMVAAFMGPEGSQVGYAELKLHDDKGDLELWLATDEGVTKPFDLPLDANISVAFAGKGKTVTLAARNKDKNEDEDGTPNNRSGKTNYFIFPGDTGEDASWLMGKEFEADVVVSFTHDGGTYKTASFHLMPHTHAEGHGDHDGMHHGPHDGMVVPFMDAGGNEVGHVELKLHDDKGDLELWIATDEGITKPFDLPMVATIKVDFPDRSKAVMLAVRNKDQNEDEDGTATMRDGKTNYFIFPGDTGEDATWLMGKDFKADVTITFELDGKAYMTKPFKLIPHTHGAGDHDHDHK